MISPQNFTEAQNYLTQDIDMATPEEMLRLFRQSDSQIYNGFEEFPAITDELILDKLEKVILATAKVLKNSKNSAIVISGAGTSGRVATLISEQFNQLLPKLGLTPCFYPLIAGGNLALIKAQEGAEDDAVQAVKDMRQFTDGKKLTAYFGVTCGMSAPYISGQLNYTAPKKEFFSVLMGFNPSEASRDVPIENWNYTFKDIVKKIEKNDSCVILNPILGPEPITGSTRMKGGSATILLLEVIFALALWQTRKLSLKSLVPLKSKTKWTLREAIMECLYHYELTRVHTYRNIPKLSELITKAGKALRSGGSIYYLGNPPCGLLGTVDASECPPTFGADFEDVRGFVIGGWKSILGKGKDLSDEGEFYRISVVDFIKDILPKLSKKDIVIAIGCKTIPKKLRDLIRISSEKGAQTGVIAVNGNPATLEKLADSVCPSIPVAELIEGIPSYAVYATKLCLNAITTGGHILAGKIYQNRMIDLKVSNNKLYYRTINIISSVMNVDTETATKCLHKAIYETDKVSAQITKTPISSHIEASTGKLKVVPTAMLLATGKFNYKSARKALESEPIVRNIIQSFIEKGK